MSIGAIIGVSVGWGADSGACIFSGSQRSGPDCSLQDKISSALYNATLIRVRITPV